MNKYVPQTEPEISFTLPLQHDIYEDLTEQEHKESCDINVMIRNVQNGIEARGRVAPIEEGYDDTTMSGLDFRITKANLERELAQVAESHEFTEDELKMMPPKVAEKYRFKTKAKQSVTNDDKTTKKDAKPEPSPEPEKTKTATASKTTNE